MILKTLLLFCFVCISLIDAGKQLTVLIKMIPAQEKFFKEVIIKDFENKRKCKVNVITFKDNWEMPERLKSTGPAVDVVKAPMGTSHSLAAAKLLKPINSIVEKTWVLKFRNELPQLIRGPWPRLK